MTLRRVLFLILIASILFSPLTVARAATFMVTSTSDAADTQTDGECETGDTGADCTLRAAIEEANQSAGPDTIQFNIPGEGPHTIALDNGLMIEDALTIDGTTQPGYRGSPLIELDGSRAGQPMAALEINSVSTVKGLAINNFSNDQAGILLFADGNVIQSNYLGVAPDGTTARPNDVGIFIFSANNLIGGENPGEGNRIAFNERGGLWSVSDGRNNAFLRNSIYENGSIGIDLIPGFGADGITPNDVDDADEGPNGLQNFPVMASAPRSCGATEVQGDLDALAATTYRIDFYSNTSCDPSGYGEGEVFVGTLQALTDEGGHAALVVSLPEAEAGRFLTALATGPEGTSEFSPCMEVVEDATDSDGDGIPDACDVDPVFDPGPREERPAADPTPSPAPSAPSEEPAPSPSEPPAAEPPSETPATSSGGCNLVTHGVRE